MSEQLKTKRYHGREYNVRTNVSYEELMDTVAQSKGSN
jgi:hypothetical protein